MVKKRAFTLIELLVVIAIIGILSGIVLVSLGGARRKARDARREADIRQIVSAQEMCYDDANCGGGAEQYFTHGDCTSDAAGCLPPIGDYLGELDDPLNSGTYVYHWLDNTACPEPGQHFCVYAVLERGGYFAASEKGTKELTSAPTSGCACW